MKLWELTYLTLIIFILPKQINGSYKYEKTKTIEILSDLPSHKDLFDYIHSLERIINLWLQNKNKLNLNFVFGLFLVNVNLKPFIKDDSLPKYLQNRLNNLLVKNEKLQEFYELKVLEDSDDIPLTDKIILRLFTDGSWAKKLVKFNLKLLKQTYKYDFEFPEWNTYAHEVDIIDKWVPSPQLSDKCLVSLALNEENLSKYSKICKIPRECYHSQVFGTNFGYALTHRFLLLVLAGLNRGCTIFSVHQDLYARHLFCEIIYREAEYNAMNGFKIVDLMLEQMALCSLDGHAQFLRRSWISRLMRYQTPYGCFSQTLSSKELFKKFLEGSDGKDGVCNGHVTSVAAATLAGAIRFLLEKL